MGRAWNGLKNTRRAEEEQWLSWFCITRNSKAPDFTTIHRERSALPVPGVPLLPQPRNLHQPHCILSTFTLAEPTAPKTLGFGFSLLFFWVFLNFSRETLPPSLQCIEFPKISHEVSWDFTCPMPSSIILVVKYSLQHCIQNLCPHSRPVKYCNDKEHKTWPHFITWIDSITSPFLVLCSSSIPSLIPHTKAETLQFTLHHHPYRTVPRQL